MWGARLTGVLLLGAAIAGCKEDIEFNDEIPGTFDVTYTPHSMTLGQGQSGRLELTATRSGGYPGAITFDASGVPAGVKDSIRDPISVGDVTESNLDLYVSASAVPGVYKFVIRGLGEAEGTTGSVTKVVYAVDTFELTITLKPGLTMTVDPASPVISQGGQTVFTAHIGRTGNYAEPSTLDVTSLPAGVTAVVANPNDSTPTITVNVAPGVAVGAYSFVARAAGPNTDTVKVTVPFTVDVPTNVTIDPSTCAGTFNWLAIQDGENGTWTQVTATGGTYTFGATNAKVGLAFVTTSGVAKTLTVRYFDRTELAQLAATGQLGGNCASGKTLNGVFAGASGASGLSAELANSFTLEAGSATTFQLDDVIGTTGILLGRHLSSGNSVLDLIFAYRGVDISAIANNGSVPDVDFASDSAFAPDTAMISVTGTDGETLISTISSLVNSDCSDVSLLWATGTAALDSVASYQVPTAKLASGENNYFTALTTGSGFSRSSSVLSNGVRSVSIALPAKLPITEPAVLSGTYQRLQFAFILPADMKRATAGYSFGVNSVSMSVSEKFLGGLTVNLSTPNFSSVGGWSDLFAPPAGSASSWTVSGLSNGTGCALLKTSTKFGTLP